MRRIGIKNFNLPTLTKANLFVFARNTFALEAFPPTVRKSNGAAETLFPSSSLRWRSDRSANRRHRCGVIEFNFFSDFNEAEIFPECG